VLDECDALIARFEGDALAQRELATAESARGDAAATRVAELHARYRGVASDLAASESRLHTIEELEATLEGHVPGTRAVVEAAARGDLTGLHGVVSNLIDVDERYARALDVAFGAGLSNIVTATSEDAERAVAYLREREAGRATFLPLDTLAHRDGHKLGALQGRPGIIGYAHELVRSEAASAASSRFSSDACWWSTSCAPASRSCAANISAIRSSRSRASRSWAAGRSPAAVIGANARSSDGARRRSRYANAFRNYGPNSRRSSATDSPPRPMWMQPARRATLR